MSSANSPRTNLDLFADEVLQDPYPFYAELRAQGPAVYLDRHDAWALTHYQHVRAALRDWESFSSAEGVALNDPMNEVLAGTVLASDPPGHEQLRAVLSEQLAPRALRALGADIAAKADALVDDLVRRRSFDAVTDLARAFPLSVVVDLIGLPDSVRGKLLGWADSTFTVFGPMNERTQNGFPGVGEMFAWLQGISAEDLRPGSMGRAIFDAADRGAIGRESCVPLLSAYTTAGMDTTISAVGNAVFLFARHPDQWDIVRTDPSLIGSAFNEVLRYDAPVQAFTRVTRTDYDADGIRIPAGARVVLLYGSGNRDDRHYPEPDRFDVTRNPVDHLSFGYGIHACAGQGLARLEAHAAFTALVRRVHRIHIGEPIRHLNNVTRGLESLPVTSLDTSPLPL